MHSDRTGGDEAVSDTSQGQGWWLASDGKWYPPELWTGPPQTGPTQTGPTGAEIPGAAQVNEPAEQGQATQPLLSDTTQAQPGGGIPPYPGAGTSYGGASEAYPGQAGQPQYPPSAYGAPMLKVKTNGMAVASLICSCAGVILFTLPCILGVIFGFVARSQIRRSQGTQKGDGLALAGIIVGFAGIAILIVIVAVRVAHNHNNGVIDGSFGPTMTVLGW